MKKRIIICGLSRSGTSLLYTLLANALPNIRFMEKEKSALNYEFDDDICLTKRPLDCFNLDQIMETYAGDDIRLLFSIRDPRDVICSVHQAAPHDYFIGFQNQYFINSAANLATLTNPGLWDTFQVWSKYSKLPQIRTVRYEDLVTNAATTLERIGIFLDEDLLKNSQITEATRIPEGMKAPLNGIRKIDSKSVGIWRKHPQRVWQEFTNHEKMHLIMSQWNYEANPNWFLRHFGQRLPINFEWTTN